MNGSHVGNSAHTVSPKQARHIIAELESTISIIKVNIENETNSFFKELSTLWADENAVSAAAEIKRKMESAFNDANEHLNVVKSQICFLVNSYAGAGGINRVVDFERRKLYSSIDCSCVKSSFDGDKFGFYDSNSVSTLIESFESFKKRIFKIIQDFHSKASSINVFGNAGVRKLVLSKISDATSGCYTYLDECSKYVRSAIEQTRAGYNNASSQASSSKVGSFIEEVGTHLFGDNFKANNNQVNSEKSGKDILNGIVEQYYNDRAKSAETEQVKNSSSKEFMDKIGDYFNIK